MTSNPLACPQCGCERRAADPGPLLQCPRCRVVFASRQGRVAAPRVAAGSVSRVALALCAVHLGLLFAGAAFYVAAKPIAALSVVLGGLPAGLFLGLAFVAPVIPFLGGMAVWRSTVAALVLGAPLIPLSAFVCSIAGSGSAFLGVPVPWPSAVALGTAGDSLHMLRAAAGPNGAAFVAGLLVGLIGRRLSAKAEPGAGVA